jgi:hypothetical protein
MIEVKKFTHELYTCYYIKGTYILHREDGPAIIYIDGHRGWCLNGMSYNKEAWFEALNEKQQEKMLYSEYFVK